MNFNDFSNLVMKGQRRSMKIMKWLKDASLPVAYVIIYLLDEVSNHHLLLYSVPKWEYHRMCIWQKQIINKSSNYFIRMPIKEEKVCNLQYFEIIVWQLRTFTWWITLVFTPIFPFPFLFPNFLLLPLHLLVY